MGIYDLRGCQSVAVKDRNNAVHGAGVFLMACRYPPCCRPLFIEGLMIAAIICIILLTDLWWVIKRGFIDYYKSAIK